MRGSPRSSTALFALAALVCAAAMAQPRETELLRHGHTRFERVVPHAIPGSPGRHTYETVVTFLGETTRIPLEKGHGYSIYLVPRGGADGAKAEVRWTVRSPAPGMRDPRAGTVDRELTASETGAFGREMRVGWQFDFDFQMLPGDWTIDVTVNGGRWRSFSFTAVPKP